MSNHKRLLQLLATGIVIVISFFVIDVHMATAQPSKIAPLYNQCHPDVSVPGINTPVYGAAFLRQYVAQLKTAQQGCKNKGANKLPMYAVFKKNVSVTFHGQQIVAQ